MGVRAEIVAFEAADGVRLSGALFHPRRREPRAGVVYLHGNGDSSIFRTERTNALAERLTAAGFAFFPFDNRGSGLMRWTKRRVGGETEYGNGGTAYERIGDAPLDIRGALRVLRSRGVNRIFLAGHSTGANKIVLYDARGRNRVTGYVLIAGGDDTGFYRMGLGRRRFERALSRARKEVAKGRADRWIPRSYSPFPMSWGAFLDTIDPDGDYNQFPFGDEIYGWNLSSRTGFALFSEITKKTLVVYGSEDEFAYGDVGRVIEILKDEEHARAKISYEQIEGASHGFAGYYDQLADVMIDWMGRVLP